MARKAISLEELYHLLDGEFHRARPQVCRACITPFPLRRIPADEVSTNWFITEPVECPHECFKCLGEIVARLMADYELERRPAHPVR